MALLERFRVLVWGGGALLGWVAGDIMTSDPAVANWLGEATASGLHVWGGRIGALIVVCTGLWIVRQRRLWTAEEVWTFVAVLVWIAGDIAINLSFAEAEAAKRWAMRLVIFLILTSDYVVLRSRQIEEIEEVEEIVVKRERDKV